MLTTAAATLLFGEVAMGIGAQPHPPNPSPGVQAQRKAFFALWLLISGRQDFFFIDQSSQPPVTIKEQDNIAADLSAFFTDPTTQMTAIRDALMKPSPYFNGPNYLAFQTVRDIFHTLGTTAGGGTALPPYQPGEVCGHVSEIMAIAGVTNPSTPDNPGATPASSTKKPPHK
jgi:hypothetical protein